MLIYQEIAYSRKDNILTNIKIFNKKRIQAYLLSMVTIFILFIELKPSTSLYDIKGVDVSRYQGNINWQAFESQNVKFAFIKATEGSSHVDKYFSRNWKNVANTNILATAYHFFSFESSGITQAENFISTVGKRKGMLPPVVDVEFYADYFSNPPNKEKITYTLSELLNQLEKFYNVKPIIYTTYKAYEAYIKDNFTNYPLWIRNVYINPSLTGIDSWIFWQYSDEGKLYGHQGKAIDLNIYRESFNQLKKLTLK